MFKFFQKLFGKAEHVAQPKPKEELYFIETKLLGTKKESQSGLIESLELLNGGTFKRLKFVGDAAIESKHRGISIVVQAIELNFEAPFLYADLFAKGKKTGISYSLIHKTSKGQYELFGENKGMLVTEISETQLKLHGEEDDAFYKLTQECAEVCIGK